MKNPDYESQMKARRLAQSINRERTAIMPKIAVPKQPNRYLPHYGAKEAARHAGKTSLGPNASRALHHQDDSALRVGDTVTWVSSNKEKVGTIIAMVPTGMLPREVLTDSPSVKGAHMRRDHDSFVVRVGKTRYWPRVSLLNKE